MKNWLIIFTILFSTPIFSQNYSFKKKQTVQKGAVYFYWGYNRSIYAKSDITFSGENYEFTVLNATAHDNPSTELKTYVNPATLSVPQFNIRAGYYFKQKWDISFGYDHMKYLMTDYQEAKLVGEIPGSENSYLNGTFDHEIYTLTPRGIHYENSNGLNYISLQINRSHKLYRSHNRKLYLVGRLGFGMGGVVTQTDFNWNNKGYHTDLKLSGFGGSVHTGLRLDIINRFFVQSNWSVGYINLPNLRTIAGTENFASQDFIYADMQLVAGVFFYLRTKNDCGTCPDW